MQTNSRIEWWWQLGLGRPELSPASTLAVAGSRGSSVVDATMAGEARAGHLCALRGAGRELSTTAGPLGGRRLVGGGHRRRRVRASKVRRLRRTRARTERGKRFSGSRRLQQTSKRARGRPDGDESTMGIRGGRR